MKNRRQGHFKPKARRGSHGDRFGPRRGHGPREAAKAEPRRKDRPTAGLPTLTILKDGTVRRRRR